MHLLLLSSSFAIYRTTTRYSQFCLKAIYFFLFLSAGKPFNVEARAARVQRAVIKVFHYNVDFLFHVFGVCGVNTFFGQKVLIDGTLFKTAFVKYFVELLQSYIFIIFRVFISASLVSILIKGQRFGSERRETKDSKCYLRNGIKSY